MADALTRIAAHLYISPLPDFVTARAAQAEAAGDPELAARIRRLRKPSIAAWIVNLFAHDRADRLGQALELAGQLREAQSDLDAAALSKLGRQRRALTNQLAREATSLAEARGERVTTSTLEAVQQTISAAFFDPGAAAAVASGRLVRELEPSGEFPLDPDAVVAGGFAPAPMPAPRRPDEVKARRERREAERAVHAAEQQLARARREQDELAREQRDTASLLERLRRRIAELEAELARVRAEAERAAADIESMTDRTAEAAHDVVGAETALADARAALEEL